MRPEFVDAALEEYALLRDPAGDPELEAVKAAIFLEDVFGVTLTDVQIAPEVIGSADGMRSVVTGRHGAA